MVQSIFLACSLITGCIQLGGWAVAYALRTEKFYDILGGLNFLAVGAFSAATAEGWEADPRKYDLAWEADPRKVAATLARQHARTLARSHARLLPYRLALTLTKVAATVIFGCSYATQSSNPGPAEPRQVCRYSHEPRLGQALVAAPLPRVARARALALALTLTLTQTLTLI
eukprot:scaffold67800_cov32-Phaeocystis_antarctica.AAC.1